MPEAESGAAAAASSGASLRATTKPWPGSLMFQPKPPSRVAGEGDRVGDRVLAGDASHLLRDLGDLAHHVGGDRRGGAEHVDRHPGVASQRRGGRRRQLLRAGEEDRVAGAGRPGGGRHREAGLRDRGDDDVLRRGAEEPVAQGRDRGGARGGLARLRPGRPQAGRARPRRRSRRPGPRRSSALPCGSRASQGLDARRRAAPSAPEIRIGARTGAAISTAAAIAPCQSASSTRVTAAGRCAVAGRGEDGERDAGRVGGGVGSRRPGSCCWSRRPDSRARSVERVGRGGVVLHRGVAADRGRGAVRAAPAAAAAADDRGDDEDDRDRRRSPRSAFSGSGTRPRRRFGALARRLRASAAWGASARPLAGAASRRSLAAGTSALIGRFLATAGKATCARTGWPVR